MRKLNLPLTRYSGSKRKLINRIWSEIEKREIVFNSVLDIFGGSAVFSYFAKTKGKLVLYNDILKFNYLIGQALIANPLLELSLKEALELLNPRPDIDYKYFISEYYKDIYYLDSENKLIDTIVQNIELLNSDSKKYSAYYILFQTCLIKRPYNLFHRKNLNLRTNYSSGNFGNKVTWERSFEELFSKFYQELQYFTFDNGFVNLSLNFSALECKKHADLIYIDPPYFHNSTHVSYHSKYHFLEGLSNYHKIPESINFATKHREIQINKSKQFEDSNNFLIELGQLLKLNPNSVIVLSYRSNGVPTLDEIEILLKKFRNNVQLINLGK